MTRFLVRDYPMHTIKLADAKARLSELLTQVADGETVCITRHGKPIARLTPVERPRKPISLDQLRQVTQTMPHQAEDGEAFMRRLRDDARY